MNRAARRSPQFKAAFSAEQAKQSKTLTPVPRDKWPESFNAMTATPIEVWRSRDFIVILYVEGANVRMTVNRAELGKGWKSEISWDELQLLKTQIGRGDQWAVECFPPDSQVVNVANMRHLWLLYEEPEYGWKGR